MSLQQFAPTAGGASDIFLHVQTRRAGKVRGESLTPDHRDDIDVVGWSWGVSANTAIGASASTARRAYRQLVVTKRIDAASTGLLAALVTNDEVREATLTMRKAGGEVLDYFRMTLGGARVVDVDLGVGVDGRPVERVTFAFTGIDIEYRSQQSAGSGSGSMSFHDEVLPA